MGVFSWITSDTKKAIKNKRVENRDPKVVHLLVPEEFGGKSILEEDYDGYGTFGGFDVYELLDMWNNKVDLEDTDRNRGIHLYFDGEPKYTIKIVEDPYLKYEDVEPSEQDPNQGMMTDEEENQ